MIEMIKVWREDFTVRALARAIDYDQQANRLQAEGLGDTLGCQLLRLAAAIYRFKASLLGLYRP